MRDQAKNLATCLVGPWILNRISLFCRSSDSRFPEVLASRLSATLACHCRIGVGRPAGDPAEIHRSYHESLVALISGGNQAVCCFEDLPGPVHPGLPSTPPREQELYAWIQQGRSREASLAFDSLLEDLKVSLAGNEPAIRRRLMEILIVAQNTVGDSHSAGHPAASSAIMDGFDAGLPFASWVSRCRELVDQSCTGQAILRSARPTDLVSQARAFIETRYGQEIGIEDIASHVGVSSGHLSHVFKQDTGTTVLDYLTDWRLAQARKLLKQARISVKQVAGLVGYRDPNYFSRIFRQRSGMTVSDFRQSVVEC